LLAADDNTRIRFVPNPNFNGTPGGISFRAWDRTEGFAGSTADTSAFGGSTAFSAEIATTTTTVNPINNAPIVNPVNNAPVLNGSLVENPIPIDEDITPNNGDLVSNIPDASAFTDLDTDAVLGLVVTAADNTNGTGEYSTNNVPILDAPLVQNSALINASTTTNKDNRIFSVRSAGGANFNDPTPTVDLGNEPLPVGTQVQGEWKSLDLRNQPERLMPADIVVNREAAFDNSFGFYAVDNLSGSIGGLQPGDAGYAEAAIANQLDLAAGLTGGLLLAPFLIANGSVAQFLAQNPNNQLGQGPMAYFGYLGANPDGAEHVRLQGDNTFAFEDLFSGGDGDFNDLIVQINFT
jgi:hypothetical protein